MPTSTPENLPPLEPRWQRIALIDEIQDNVRNHGDEAAVLINEDLESAVVLEGDVEPFEQDGQMLFPNNRLGLVFFRRNRVSVITYYGGGRTWRQDYSLRPTESFLDNLDNHHAHTDSFVRLQLSRTTFSLELAEARLEWYRTTLGGLDLDIAQRVKWVSGGYQE